MARTKQRRGYHLKQRPGEYIRTPQQQKLIDALEFCDIRKGISKAELMDRMKNCLPEYYKGKGENKI